MANSPALPDEHGIPLQCGNKFHLQDHRLEERAGTQKQLK